MVLTSEGWRDRLELNGYGGGYGVNARLANASGNYFGIVPSDDRGFFPDSGVEPGPRRSTDPVPGSNRDQVKQAVYRSFAEDVAARKAEQPSFASPGMSGVDKAHLLLGGVNLIADGPFAPVGAVAGVIDAGLYLYEGKKVDAGLSLAGTIPLLGAAFPVGRVVRVGDDLASGVVATRVSELGQEGHALARHGGAVTNEQLFTRAITGVAPDGSVALAKNGQIRLPPSSTAFNSDQLLVQSDLLIRQKYLDQAIASLPPGATRAVVEAVDTGTVVGRGYDRVTSTVGGVGPLRYHDSLTHVQGIYDYHAQSGAWLTTTIFPVRK
jgi:hypothetical protein